MARTFQVQTNHVAPQFAGTFTATVKEDSEGGFYAQMSGFGCSRTCSTPERAISSMLADHACTNIRITEIEVSK